jgi:hypothetical protein
MAVLEREIARLPAGEGGAMTKAFAELTEQLALGTEPEVRECPVCKSSGRRMATRCLQCWSLLTPP